VSEKTDNNAEQPREIEMEQIKKENERLKEESLFLKEELERWEKMLELYGINDERMSAALSFAFGDEDSSMDYLEDMLNLSERDLEWYSEMYGDKNEG